MALDQSTLAGNEFKRDLIQKRDDLTEKIKNLNNIVQQAQELEQELVSKTQECLTLRERFQHLTTQNFSFSIDEEGQRLRHVGGLSARDITSVEQNSLSWDFEGMAMGKDEKTTEPRDKEKLDKAIARLKVQLNSYKMELELTQKQIIGDEGLEKALEDVPRGFTRDRTPEKNVQQLDVMITAGNESSKVYELKKVVELQDKRIEELLESDRVQKSRINVLTKEKEELLQVNHQWDEQYRLLKADKQRLSAELQKKGRTADVAEHVQRSRAKSGESRSIEELNEKNRELIEQLLKYEEKEKKNQKLWVAAKKMIEEERDGRAAAVQRSQVAEERCRELQLSLEVEKEKQVFLNQEMEKLVVSGDANGAASLSSMTSANMAEHIEMLKQQLSVYADDFASERSDRERIQGDREALKEKLVEYQKEILALKEQLLVYRDDFDYERREKERLQRQLRERDPVRIQEEPWYLVPPNDYVAMQPAARRQPLYQERGYRYTPREIQEMALQQQQQQLQPRGSTGGHPGGLCHGCEADGNVIDGSSV